MNKQLDSVSKPLKTAGLCLAPGDVLVLPQGPAQVSSCQTSQETSFEIIKSSFLFLLYCTRAVVRARKSQHTFPLGLLKVSQTSHNALLSLSL